MIKLSRSKVFLLANILSRAGPCSNYSSSDKFNMELITERENLFLWALTSPLQRVNRHHFECAAKLSSPWWIRPDCGDGSVCQIQINFPPTSELGDPRNWHLIYISSPLQLSWLQHKKALYKIYRVLVESFSFFLIYFLGSMTDFLYKVIIGISIQIDGRIRLSPGWTSLRQARGLTFNSSGTNMRGCGKKCD